MLGVSVDSLIVWTTFTKNKRQISFDANLKKKLKAYYFLQFRNLQLLLMDLLVIHLQNIFQALQVLFKVFIWSQSILKENEKGCSFIMPLPAAAFCIIRDLPLSAHQCSCEELLQIASLGLSGYDSETSVCPLDPDNQTDIKLLTASTTYKLSQSVHL